MLRWALTMSVLSLGLLGCTEHRLGPRETYVVGACYTERVTITNKGPGDVSIRTHDTMITKAPRPVTEFTARAGDSRCYRTGGLFDGLFIEIVNADFRDAVVVVDRDPLGKDELEAMRREDERLFDDLRRRVDERPPR